VALFQNNDGNLAALLALRDSWLKTLRIGLFQNDQSYFPEITMAQIEPCDFSGYIGLRNLATWGGVSLDGVRARVEHVEILWHHDGGSTPNYVFGYYVVNASGTLVYLERKAGDPGVMDASGQVYRVVPGYTFRSEVS
jgi:hypothetical protein